MKMVLGNTAIEFSGNNFGFCVTLFNEKLISKIKEDCWDEVLLQCMLQDSMDDIQSGDEMGDVSMLDHVAGDMFVLDLSFGYQ